MKGMAVCQAMKRTWNAIYLWLIKNYACINAAVSPSLQSAGHFIFN